MAILKQIPFDGIIRIRFKGSNLSLTAPPLNDSHKAYKCKTNLEQKQFFSIFALR